MAETAETNEMVNGAAEQRTSSKESSPIPSPTSDRKAKSGVQAQTAATLPAKTQEIPSAQMEGFLHRKHEWETHSKKASSRYSAQCVTQVWQPRALPKMAHNHLQPSLRSQRPPRLLLL